MKKNFAIFGVLTLCACSTGPYEPTLSKPPESLSMFQDDTAACRKWAEPMPGVERPGSLEDRVDGCMKNKCYPVE
ncbi:MAG: hypothetical protein PHW76_03895 [Alphaproteobacteria bacterium]|nr:hypothetical protein [Alphaproteobacteria bacterium]